MGVSYEKVMRKRAIDDRKGLYTIEVIGAGKAPGKFGGGMTMQGPASEEEYKEISAFMLQLMKKRSQAKAEGRGT